MQHDVDIMMRRDNPAASLEKKEEKGFFSWLDCRNGEQIRIGINRKVYLPIPEEFGHKPIKNERRYLMDNKRFIPIPKQYGGGHAAEGQDVFELLADWNKPFLNEGMLKKVSIADFRGEYSSFEKALRTRYQLKKCLKDFRTLSDEDMADRYDNYKHMIGEAIADAGLPYPIKVTSNPDISYEDVA